VIVLSTTKCLPIDSHSQVFCTDVQIGESDIILLIEGEFDLAIGQILATT
jgi:hypothetical protein